jgi:hypothetical protein
MTITEGSDATSSLPKSTFKGDRIPNSAIFLKRTAIEFLQILFGTRARGAYHYDPDDTKTDIQISDINAADLTAINLRPAIIVARGPMNWQGLGLGNSGMESKNMQSGDTTYNDLLVGSLSISCMSREGIEAEQIAHLVFNSFKFFTPTLRKRGFFTIRSLNIGGESLVEQEGASDETYIVPIFVTAQVQERWTLSQDAARRLEDILVSSLLG